MTLPDLTTVHTAAGPLSCRETGQGPALVLLHGLNFGSACWRAQYAHFGRDFRVIGWDAPGYGGSAPPSGAAPVAGDFADALAALLDALGVETCNLVGHSMGGLVAAAFCRRHPGRAHTVTFSHAADGLGAQPAEAQAAYVAERWGRYERLGAAALGEQTLADMVSPSAPGFAREEIGALLAELPAAGYRAGLSVLARSHLFAELPPLAAPVLVLTGDDDTRVDPTVARSLAAALAGAQLMVQVGVGHVSFLEDPEQYNECLRVFLQETG